MKGNRKNMKKGLAIFILLTLLLGVILYFTLNTNVFHHKFENKFDASEYFNEFVNTNKEADIYLKENSDIVGVMTVDQVPGERVYSFKVEVKYTPSW